MNAVAGEYVIERILIEFVVQSIANCVAKEIQ